MAQPTITGERMTDRKDRKWKTRLVRGRFPDRSFDIEFWQEQGDEAIFRAAWELVVLAEEEHGRKTVFRKDVTRLIKNGEVIGGTNSELADGQN